MVNNGKAFISWQFSPSTCRDGGFIAHLDMDIPIWGVPAWQLRTLHTSGSCLHRPNKNLDMCFKIWAVIRSKCVRCSNVLKTFFYTVKWWELRGLYPSYIDFPSHVLLPPDTQKKKKNPQPPPPKRCIYKFPETHRWYMWIDVKVESKLPSQNYK